MSRALAVISIPEPDAFDLAKAAWNEGDQRHRRLLQDRDDMFLALSVTNCGINPDSVGIRERAARFLDKAKRRPKALLDDIDDLNIELDALIPQLEPLRRAYDQAAQDMTDRIAAGLSDRHKAAVRALANAIEALSIAAGAEIQIRDELASTAPCPASSLLPDFGSTWRGVLLNNPQSAGSKLVAAAEAYSK